MTNCEQLLCFCGFSVPQIDTRIRVVSQYLKTNPNPALGQIAATLGSQFVAAAPQRRAIVACQLGTAFELPKIADWSAEITPRHHTLAFLFAGIGDHYRGMAQTLAKSEPTFQAALAACDRIIQREMGQSLFTWLYADEKAQPATQPLDLRALLGRGKTVEKPLDPLQQTAIAHPAVFAIEYALTQLLAAWGIRPNYLIGYSLGEFVAACVANVLSLDDALTLVIRRAALIDTAPQGRMLAIPLPLHEAEMFISAEISLAAHTAPHLTILSGEKAAIEQLHATLLAQAIPARILSTTHAFHSHMLQPLQADLAAIIATMPLQPPTIPIVSCITGKFLTDQQATDPAYWVQQMCNPIQFFSGLQTLLNTNSAIFIEIGPGQSLGAFLKQHPDAQPEHLRNVFPTLAYSYTEQNDRSLFLSTLGKLWVSGINLDFSPLKRYQILPALAAQLQTPQTPPVPLRQRKPRKRHKQRHVEVGSVMT